MYVYTEISVEEKKGIQKRKSKRFVIVVARGPA